jgi:hypothetical protein
MFNALFFPRLRRLLPLSVNITANRLSHRDQSTCNVYLYGRVIGTPPVKKSADDRLFSRSFQVSHRRHQYSTNDKQNGYSWKVMIY